MKIITYIILSVFFLIAAGTMLLGDDTDDYDIMMNDALTYLELGDTNSSVDTLRQMTRYFGEDSYIKTVYGVNLLIGGYGNEAQKIFAAEDNQAAKLCRAILLARKAQYKEAIAAFQEFDGKINNYNFIIDFLKTMENAEYINPELPADTLPAIELHAYWNMLRENIDLSLEGLTRIAQAKGRDIYKDTKGVITVYDYKKPIFFNADPIRGKIGLDLQVEKADYSLKGKATIKADIANSNEISSVLLYIDGKMKSMTNSYPYTFTINTENIINGIHDVRISARDKNDGIINEKVFTVEIFNQKEHKAPNEKMIIERLTEFAAPRQGMETVNYLMAVCAAHKKDLQLHRTSLERCVAVNPMYKDASELLRKYYFVSGGKSIIEKGNPSKKQICLSFDDGPTPDTLDNLKILKKYGAKATFFIVGRQAEKYPDIIRQIAADGHQIALHSQNHPNYTTLEYVDIVKETLQCYCALKEIGGNPTLFFRPPGGNRDAEQAKLSAEYGIHIGLWTKNTTHIQESTAEILTDYCCQSMKPGFIYLMHNHTTAITQALPKILEYAAQNGYKCVTMEEIIK